MFRVGVFVSGAGSGAALRAYLSSRRGRLSHMPDRNGWRAICSLDYGGGPKTSAAFVPPKPKEFDSA